MPEKKRNNNNNIDGNTCWTGYFARCSGTAKVAVVAAGNPVFLPIHSRHFCFLCPLAVVVSCDCNWWTVRIKSTNTVNPPIFNRHGHTLWIQGFIPDQYPPLHTHPPLLLLFRVNFFHCTRRGLLFNSRHTSQHGTSLDQLTTEALDDRFAFSGGRWSAVWMAS